MGNKLLGNRSFGASRRIQEDSEAPTQLVLFDAPGHHFTQAARFNVPLDLRPGCRKPWPRESGQTSRSLWWTRR